VVTRNFLFKTKSHSPKHKLLLGMRWLQLISRKHLNAKNCLQMEMDVSFVWMQERVLESWIYLPKNHAALTAREIIIANNLKPEQSINANLNYIKKINFDNGTFIGIETSFSIRDSAINCFGLRYESQPNYLWQHQWLCDKRNQYKYRFQFSKWIKIITGASLLDNKKRWKWPKRNPFLTEKFTATWCFI
jgi:outer membrane receptor for ferrienterochelin and colicins